MERIENPKCAIYVSEETEYNIPQNKQVAFLKNMFNSWNSDDNSFVFKNPILVDTYVDTETDRRSPNYKKEFERLLSDAAEGKVNYVYCISFTAISMNYVDCIKKLKQAIANVYPIPLEFNFIIEHISTEGDKDYSLSISFEQTLKEIISKRKKMIREIKRATGYSLSES